VRINKLSSGAKLLNLRTTKKEKRDSGIGECDVLFPSGDDATTRPLEI